VTNVLNPLLDPYSVYKAMFCSGSGLRGDASTSTSATEITSASKRKKLRLELLGEAQLDPPSQLSNEIEHYLTLPVPREFEDDPLAFWRHYENSFPLLSKVAQVYLGISSSSVPVECMFSTTGLIANAKRSSIGPEKLNRVLFVHDNFEFATSECSS
jgi:hypothetical protein